jgi:hypothetical protein
VIEEEPDERERDDIGGDEQGEGERDVLQELLAWRPHGPDRQAGGQGIA